MLKHFRTTQRKSLLAASLLLVPSALLSSSAMGANNFTAVHPERGGVLLESGELNAKRVPLPAAKLVPPIDVRRSIFVTDKKIVEELSFADVMQQLVDQSGDPTLTKEKLFQQWWDSQNQRPGIVLRFGDPSLR
jgi:hypothetical protein